MKRWHWILLCLMTIVSLLAGFTLPHDAAHDEWWNRIPAFFTIFGFGGCLFFIFFAKFLGKVFLRKKEHYYDAD